MYQRLLVGLVVFALGCLLGVSRVDAATPSQNPPCDPGQCQYQPSQIVHLNDNDQVPYRQLPGDYVFGPEFRHAAEQAYRVWQRHHDLTGTVARRIGVDPRDCTATCWWFHMRVTLNCVHQSYNEMGPVNGCEANPGSDPDFTGFMRNPVTKFVVLCGGGALFTYATAGEGGPVTEAFLAREAAGCGVGWFLDWTYNHIFG
jgi:hypothetical protein